MNRNRCNLDIVKDMLRMGSKGEDSIGQRYGLASEEFSRYRNYLLEAGLARIVRDCGQPVLLQPTPAGEALLRLVDRIEALEDGDGEEDETRYNKKHYDQLALSTKAMTVRLIGDKLLQAYVLEQAELTKLKAQLETNETGNEGDVELKQRERKLSMLRYLLKVVRHLAR